MSGTGVGRGGDALVTGFVIPATSSLAWLKFSPGGHVFTPWSTRRACSLALGAGISAQNGRPHTLLLFTCGVIWGPGLHTRLARSPPLSLRHVPTGGWGVHRADPLWNQEGEESRGGDGEGQESQRERWKNRAGYLQEAGCFQEPEQLSTVSALLSFQDHPHLSSWDGSGAQGSNGCARRDSTWLLWLSETRVCLGLLGACSCSPDPMQRGGSGSRGEVHVQRSRSAGPLAAWLSS